MGYLFAALFGALIGLIVSAVDHRSGGAKLCPNITMACGFTYAMIVLFGILGILVYVLLVN